MGGDTQLTPAHGVRGTSQLIAHPMETPSAPLKDAPTKVPRATRCHQSPAQGWVTAPGAPG